MSMGKTIFQDKDDRKLFNNRIIKNYLLISTYEFNKIEEISNKPISVDSFLDVCDLLNDPNKIDRNYIKNERYDKAGNKFGSIYNILSKNINELKSNFDYIELKKYDKEFQKDYLTGIKNTFKIFTNDISNSMVNSNFYEITALAPMVYLQAVLTKYDFTFDNSVITESYLLIDEKYNHKKHEKKGKEILDKMFNDSIFTLKDKNNKYGLDTSKIYNDYKKKIAYILEYKNNIECKDYDEFIAKTFLNNKIYEDKGLKANYKENYIKNCVLDFDNEVGTIRIVDKIYNLDLGKVEGLIEFKNDDKTRYFYSDNLLSDIKPSSDHNALIRAKGFKEKPTEFKNYEEFYAKYHSPIDFDKMKTGDLIKIPECLINKNSNSPREITYRITQKDNEKDNIVLAEYSKSYNEFVDNPNYFLVVNAKKGLPYQTSQKDSKYKINEVEKKVDKKKIDFEKEK